MDCALEPALSTPILVTKRFSQCCVRTQQAVLCHLQQPVFAQGAFSPLPAAEWRRLLRLTDPVIGATQDQRVSEYWVQEGCEVLLLLARHYLDICQSLSDVSFPA